MVAVLDWQGRLQEILAISLAIHSLTCFQAMEEQLTPVARPVAVLTVEVEGLLAVAVGLLVIQILTPTLFQLLRMVARVERVAQATRQELEEWVWPVVMVEQAFSALEAVAEQEVQAVVRVSREAGQVVQEDVAGMDQMASLL
jgi:hypothetical protein